MIYTDCHMHSDFSSDCPTPMEDMIRGAISRGLKTICFTEHWDPDYPANDEVDFQLDTPAYAARFFELKDKYQDKIELLFGVEFGLMPHLTKTFETFHNSWDFDFIIGSSHLLYGQDPYYIGNINNLSDQQLYRAYFESILENIKLFDGYQIYGHLDYIVRYGSTREAAYYLSDYMDIYDEILKTAIDKGVGIEINTAGLKYGLGFAHPHPDVLKRYRELGGELITIGSDAHRPEHIAYDFDKAADILKACGFNYYTIFRERQPSFLPIT